jgi:hypothetical protein
VIAPFLRTAGQMWKLMLGFALMLCGLVAIYGTLHNWWGPVTDGIFVLIVPGGIALGLASFIWMNWSIRCPQCHEKLFWRAISEKAHPIGLQSLWIMDACPYCRAQFRDTSPG